MEGTNPLARSLSPAQRWRQEDVGRGDRSEKGADADLLREMIGFAAQRPMELEVEERTWAAHGVRDPNRVNQRSRMGSILPALCVAPL